MRNSIEFVVSVASWKFSDDSEPNAIVRCTGFSIWADSTGLLGRSKQINIHTRYKIRYMPEKIEEVIVWKKAASQGRSTMSGLRHR